jgi:hypothetical protein
MAAKRKLVNKRRDGKHVRLYDYLLKSPAYLSLSCPARAVLVEVARVYNGTNNGRLGMSIRMLAERCRIARGTAGKALKELQDRGFIDCVQVGAFSRKVPHASEWRLTWWPCDISRAPPERQFLKWRPENQNTGSEYPVAGSNQNEPALQDGP